MSSLPPQAAQEQTFADFLGATSGPEQAQQGSPLLDHLVGAGEQTIRHGKAQHFRGLEIDHQLVLGRRLHRKVGRFFTFEDAIDVAGRVPVSGDLQRHLAHSWRPRRSAALYLLGCVLAAQDPRGDGGAGSHHSRQRQARPTMMRSCSPSPTASTSGGRMLASMSPSARVGTFASVRPWPGWSLRCFSRRSSGVILRLRWWRSSTSNTSAPLPSAVPSA